jgi:CIC family chloride channel protein
MDVPLKPGFGLKEEEVKRRHILPKALVIGLVAGLLSSGFREALQWSEVHRIEWIGRLSPITGLAVALLLGAVGGVKWTPFVGRRIG